MSKPASVGSVVLFTVANVNAGPKAMAAIVTALNDDGSVQLTVFMNTPGGDPRGATVIGMPRVEFTKAKAGTLDAVGYWSWTQ